MISTTPTIIVGQINKQESITLKYDRYWDKPDHSQNVSFRERH